MNTRVMALDYIKRARRCFKESEDVFNGDDYPITIRRAQECVELCLKAVLRSIAIEYPREHDVSKALERVKGTIPNWFSSKLQMFMDISLDLSKKGVLLCMVMKQSSGQHLIFSAERMLRRL